MWFAKFLEILKKHYVNITFADALVQMPSYVKFIKDILSNKCKPILSGTLTELFDFGCFVFFHSKFWFGMD